MEENQNIEWKESWRDEYLKWVCGFANAQGGKIYIGKNDEGIVTGIENSKKLLVDIPNKIQSSMSILADVNLLSEDGKEYLEIVVVPAAYPVSYKGEYYYRSGSTNQKLVGNALTRFLLQTIGTKWDAVPMNDVTADELDTESIEIFKREAKRSGRLSDAELRLTNRELMEHLGLVADNKLKRAAVLLFHRNPEKWFTGVYTKIGKFSGSEIEYMDDVHGSLILQADRVLDIIFLKYLKMSVSYKKDTRIETYPYSREALKEAVFNALCHSNWADACPIQIRIDDGQILISNSCVFPENWTADTLMSDHKSIPFNPDIANTFYRAGYIEAWGRGIKKICEACAEMGAANPEYIVHGGDVMVRFKAMGHQVLSPADKVKVRESLTPNEAKLLEYLTAHPKAIYSDIEVSLSMNRKSVAQLIRSLKEHGYIERAGAKKNGLWKIL